MMATLEEYMINGDPAAAPRLDGVGSGPRALAARGFEPPSEAAKADMIEQGMRHGQGVATDGSIMGVEFDPYPIRSSDDGPFTVGRVQFSLPAPLRFLLCNSNVLIFYVAPTQAIPANPPALVRIDLSQPSQVDTIGLPLPPLFPTSNGRAPPPLAATVYGVYCDPTGRHVVVSLSSGDNYYVSLSPQTVAQHASAVQTASRRAGPGGGGLAPLGPAIRPMPKLRGAVISAIGWHPSSYSSLGTSSPTTREILVGTTLGALIAVTLFDPTSPDAVASDLPFTAAFSRGDRGAADKLVKQVHQLPTGQGVTGVGWETWVAREGGKKGSLKRAGAVVTCATRIYQFVEKVGLAKGRREEEEADGVLERLFSAYANGNATPKFMELPGDTSRTELHFYRPPSASAPGLLAPTRIAWLTQTGIFSGDLSFGSQSPGDAIIPTSSLVPFPQSDSETLDVPLSMAMTEYHFVLLYSDCLRVVSRLDDMVVFQEPIDLRPGEAVGRLERDEAEGTYWLYTDIAIYELTIKDEGRDVWKVYLKRGDFDTALQHAKTIANRDVVLGAQADSYFKQGKYIPAAQTYAQCSKSFEEVTLGFIDREERDALRYYLIARLERLRRTDLTQRMMLATWLTEIYLAKINELDDLAASEASEDGANNLKAEQGLIEDELRQFLKTYRTHLDKRTTYDLISSHGRANILLHYASLVGDHERIIQHHVQEEEWPLAIAALSRQHDLELYYRYASVLVRNRPREATTAFSRRAELDVKRLIPALIAPRGAASKITPTASSVANGKQPVGNADAIIEYLQYTISELGNTDAAVHNALITLYATQGLGGEDGEGPLLRFLASTPDNPLTGKPYYDLDYALRLCKGRGKLQACGLIYSKMGLYESAVDLALQTGDLELAKIAADKPEDDLLLRKKLWLKIARYVVHDQKDIKTAMRFFESTDLLKIEDILPFFPDFTVIDDFKEEICLALEGYSEHIARLKTEMDDATRTAEAIKRDIADLSNRFVVLDQSDNCAACEQALLTRQFYVFPCRHSFHADCLISEFTQHAPQHQLRRLLTLQTKLAAAAQGAHRSGNGTAGGTESTLLADSKKLALASVQGLDQVRKLILPDALVGAIGGGVGAIGSGVGSMLPIPGAARSRQSMALLSFEGDEDEGKPDAQASTGSGAQDGLSTRLRVGGGNKGKPLTVEDKLKEELDELLASKCVLCDLALNSLDKGFVEDGEVDL